MNPTVHNIETSGIDATFVLKNCNVSIANALRRTIISQIPTVVFRTTPYEKSLVNITENTCRLNNEIIKQRLSCIPIHITDESVNLDDYLVELDEVNDSENIQYVTTEHFKIKNIKTEKYLDRKEVQRIFPKNELTGEYIVITRLRPSTNSDTHGESIKLVGKMTRTTAEEDSCFNVASTSAYAMTEDPVKQKQKWTEKETELKSSGLSDEEIMDEKVNWYNHDAKRVYVPDSYTFTIESIGVFTPSEIVSKACDVMKQKFSQLLNQIEGRTIDIEKSETLMTGFDIKLVGESYSVGKTLEYALYSKYYETEKVFDFVGFRKFHPHDNYSVIRLSFKDNTTNKENVYAYMKQACEDSIQAFNDIQKSFM